MYTYFSKISFNLRSSILHTKDIMCTLDMYLHARVLKKNTYVM